MREPPCARRPHARINESDAVRAAPGSPPRSGASQSSSWRRASHPDGFALCGSVPRLEQTYAEAQDRARPAATPIPQTPEKCSSAPDVEHVGLDLLLAVGARPDHARGADPVADPRQRPRSQLAPHRDRADPRRRDPPRRRGRSARRRRRPGRRPRRTGRGRSPRGSPRARAGRRALDRPPRRGRWRRRRRRRGGGRRARRRLRRRRRIAPAAAGEHETHDQGDPSHAANSGSSPRPSRSVRPHGRGADPTRG